MTEATLLVHIAAGVIAILAGAVAVHAAKGDRLHRRSGRVFVWAMLVMGATASVVAIARNIPGSIAAGPLVAYYVVTGVTAVRPLGRALDRAMAVIVLILAARSYLGAGIALTGGAVAINGVPVAMILFMGSVALAAGLSDVRLLRTGPLRGAARLRRHLWRMCFGFWIATGSFFFGQMDVFPMWLQKPALMAVPALFPLVVMAWWLWRLRARGLRSPHHCVRESEGTLSRSALSLR